MNARANGRQPGTAWSALIVERDEGRQIALRSVLRESGLFGAILSATDAREALALVAEARPDLVLAGAAGDGRVPLLDAAAPAPAAAALAGRVVVISETPLDAGTRSALTARPEVAMVATLPLTPAGLDAILAALPPRG